VARKKKQAQEPTKDELEQRRAEIEALKAEAKSYGVYITTDDLASIRRHVAKIREARKGMPPCYWRSYEKTARPCRICEVRHDCARGEEVPIEISTEELQPVPCRRCGTGVLQVELRDPETNEVRDYGCSTADCIGTLAAQQRYVEAIDKPRPRRRKPPAKITESSKKTTEELEYAILEHIRKHPGCTTRAAHKAVPGSAGRKSKALKVLEAQGEIRRERGGRQVCLYPA
jgi:hypothetical protein